MAAAGSGATRWQTGARVFGIVSGGAHAEYLVTSQDAVAGIPGHVGWNEAAAVPEAFITAHDAMIVQAELAAAETVLVHAVASGVGLAAVQLARAWGAIGHRYAGRCRVDAAGGVDSAWRAVAALQRI